jgi:hypothetical protein
MVRLDLKGAAMTYQETIDALRDAMKAHKRRAVTLIATSIIKMVWDALLVLAVLKVTGWI